MYRARQHIHRQTTRHARCSAPRARHTAKQSSLLAFSPRGHGRAPNHGLRSRGWPMRPDAKPAPHVDAVSQGGVEVCKGREGAHLLLLDADDVLGAARMQGVWPLAPPCGPSDHLQGTSGRVGRSHAGPERPPRRACRNRGGQGRCGLRTAPRHPELRDGRSGWCPGGLSSTAGGPRRRQSRSWS